MLLPIIGNNQTRRKLINIVHEELYQNKWKTVGVGLEIKIKIQSNIS